MFALMKAYVHLFIICLLPTLLHGCVPSFVPCFQVNRHYPATQNVVIVDKIPPQAEYIGCITLRPHDGTWKGWNKKELYKALLIHAGEAGSSSVYLINVSPMYKSWWNMREGTGYILKAKLYR
jgi:hypothetical protein